MAFNNCLTRDSQGQPSADINWNDHKITKLADPTQLQDAVNLRSAQNLINGDNLFINGGMEVWQEGTVMDVPASSSPIYTCDGAYMMNGAGDHIHVTAQDALIGGRYSARINRLLGEPGGNPAKFGLPLDLSACQQARGSFLAFSCVLATGSHWSPANGTVDIHLLSGDGLPVKRGGGSFTNEVTLGTTSVNLPVGIDALRVAFVTTQAVPATTQQMELQFSWTYEGTAGDSDTIFVDDCQLSIGGVPGPFQRRVLRDDLNACYRWYWKTFPLDTAPAQNLGLNYFVWPQAGAAGLAQGNQSTLFPVEMRIVPAVTLFNPAAANALVRNLSKNEDCTTGATVTNQKMFRVYYTGSASSVPGDTIAVDATFDARV